MNDRIKRLREVSQSAINHISGERARLITEFYKMTETQRMSVPVQRGRALLYLMQNKQICINPDELIVGERGPAPRACPTYPEVCIHSLDDLRILNSRPKVSYKVDDETIELYKNEIIPFWKGRSTRDKIFERMDQAWLDAYHAGIFTEFQEQRSPGHTACGDKIYKKGMLDIKNDIADSIARLDYYNDPYAFDKREELLGMDAAADAIMAFAQRHADMLSELAKNENDTVRKAELQKMEQVCRRVPAHAPQSFYEALQYYWFVHVGVITELNPWDSFNPGRLDQHLYPFYKHDIETGALTKEQAIELLQSFWIKFNNHPAPPKTGVTAKESNTYTDFALINVGGVKADGADACNELSFIIFDVVEEMRLLQPSSMLQLSKKNPDGLINRAIRIAKTGFGQPSIFNTDAIVQELVREGKSLEDARCGGASGCVEAGAFGHEAYILTGYFNLVKVLELTLNNGFDKFTGKQLGLKTGNPCDFQSMDDLMAAFSTQLSYFVNIKIKGSNIIEKVFADYMPATFLSLVIDDCVANGRDYNAGGARYNSNYIQGVGLGSITDCLTSIRYNVFDKKHFSMDKMLAMMAADFVEYEQEQAMLVYDTPKFGNDDDYADCHATAVFELYLSNVDGRPSPRGASYRVNMLPTTCHVYFGSVIGAMPDGRKAGDALSEGISPVQGADRKGPTAVIKSCAKFDHLKTGGTLLNQKFAPDFFESDESIIKVSQLVRSYFRLDGHHIQFNVVSADTLRAAQKNPEKYKDLIVRVAGYSDYFNDLTPELQEEIIRRTAHEGV